MRHYHLLHIRLIVLQHTHTVLLSNWHTASAPQNKALCTAKIIDMQNNSHYVTHTHTQRWNQRQWECTDAVTSCVYISVAETVKCTAGELGALLLAGALLSNLCPLRTVRGRLTHKHTWTNRESICLTSRHNVCQCRSCIQTRTNPREVL